MQTEAWLEQAIARQQARQAVRRKILLSRSRRYQRHLSSSLAKPENLVLALGMAGGLGLCLGVCADRQCRRQAEVGQSIGERLLITLLDRALRPSRCRCRALPKELANKACAGDGC